jgi:hypothetical protein
MAISSFLGSSALLPAGLGFRNTLTNGSFLVDQRNASASQTITSGAALAYTTDRWYAYCTGANVTGQRIAGSAPFQYNYRFTGATSNTLVGFGQRIEAANSFNCAGATATLSAYIKSSSLTSITWSLYYATTIDSFGTIASPTRTLIATGTFTINSTLTRYSTQISVPAAATTGLELVFTTGALVASQTLEFTGVQLEQNYQPTPFEQRPVGVELALCQRYYWRVTSSTIYGYLTTFENVAYTVNSIGCALRNPVPMRTAGTSVDFGGTIGAADGVTAPISGITARASANSYTSNYVTELTIDKTGSFVVYRMYILQSAGTAGAYIGVSAEL